MVTGRRIIISPLRASREAGIRSLSRICWRRFGGNPNIRLILSFSITRRAMWRTMRILLRAISILPKCSNLSIASVRDKIFCPRNTRKDTKKKEKLFNFLSFFVSFVYFVGRFLISGTSCRLSRTDAIYILQSNANAAKFLQKALGILANEAKKISAEMNNLETAQAFGKSFDRKNSVSRLRVRQFWREKGKI